VIKERSEFKKYPRSAVLEFLGALLASGVAVLPFIRVIKEAYNKDKGVLSL